jgi:hypothetical protein
MEFIQLKILHCRTQKFFHSGKKVYRTKSATFLRNNEIDFCLGDLDEIPKDIVFQKNHIRFKIKYA